MKKIFFAISLIAISFGMIASEQPDAIYKLLRRQYTLNQDGTMDINFRKEITIIRNRALTAYADKGETFITYNPEFEELTINESYTLTADGHKVETPANAFVKQLPEECANCGRYNNIVEMAIIHTGMEYNCTIVLDYTIHRKEILRSDVFTMQMDCPVEKYEIIYDHGGRVIQFDVPKVGSPVQDQHSFHWIATNIPQKSGESYTSPHDPYQVGVKFRTFIKPEIARAIPEAENILGELYKEDTMAYILAIRDWVRDNIHLNPMSPALTNYQATPAEKVFHSNCGNLLDQYVLLVAMLRHVGFEADLDNDAFDEGYFLPQQLRVSVMFDGMPYLLALNNRPAHVKNGAQELDKIKKSNSILTLSPDRIGENFYSINLPFGQSELFNPTQLPTQRTQPIFLRPTTEHHEYTIHLDGDYKLLKPVKIKYTKGNIGKIEYIIKQVNDSTLSVVRHLELLSSQIEPRQYAGFRKMIIDWNSHREIILQKK